ncbi:MAG: TatD family hydrolase [bacterium]
MLIDTHCHLYFPQFAERTIEDILEHAKLQGVEKIIVVGCSLDESLRAIALAEQFDAIYATVGIHPNDSSSLPDDYLVRLRAMAEHKKVVAIGEIGLDYFRDHDKGVQQKVFEDQIRLALEVDLPMVLHVREAYSEVIATLKTFGKTFRGVAHCFAESIAVAQLYFDLGFHFSFNGILTFPNAEVIRDTAQKLPLERILLETDAPFLAPVPFRGKTNEPAFVKFVAEELATLRGIDFATIERVTTKNATTLFSLGK